MTALNVSDKPAGEYRQYLPDLNIPRFQIMCTQDAHEYAHAFKTGKQPPWLHALYMHWLDLLKEPFKGVTTDGMEIYMSTFGLQAASLCDSQVCIIERIFLMLFS